MKWLISLVLALAAATCLIACPPQGQTFYNMPSQFASGTGCNTGVVQQQFAPIPQAPVYNYGDGVAFVRPRVAFAPAPVYGYGVGVGAGFIARPQFFFPQGFVGPARTRIIIR